jgi:hypothetical protein
MAFVVCKPMAGKLGSNLLLKTIAPVPRGDVHEGVTLAKQLQDASLTENILLDEFQRGLRQHPAFELVPDGAIRDQAANGPWRIHTSGIQSPVGLFHSEIRRQVRSGYPLGRGGHDQQIVAEIGKPRVVEGLDAGGQ